MCLVVARMDNQGLLISTYSSTPMKTNEKKKTSLPFPFAPEKSTKSKKKKKKIEKIICTTCKTIYPTTENTVLLIVWCLCSGVCSVLGECGKCLRAQTFRFASLSSTYAFRELPAMAHRHADFPFFFRDDVSFFICLPVHLSVCLFFSL